MEDKSIGKLASKTNSENMSKIEYQKIIIDTLASAKEKDYAGYSKFDALNSSILAKISGNNPWLRFAFTQMIKICPINLRPFFDVKISRNPKGIALFARAYLYLYEASKNPDYLKEAEKLLDWLIENRCFDQVNFSWGYNYTWQDIPPFVQYKGEPTSIVTIFAGEALLHGYRVTGKNNYLQATRSAIDFLTKSLSTIHETADEIAIAYILGKESSIVINIQALIAAFLTKVWQITKEEELLIFAKKQIKFVNKQKTKYNAWYYTYPPSKSPIKHDNYHTGGILDALLEFAEVANDEETWSDYWLGLEYYKKHLFETNGAPRWMSDSKFPHDAHGSAQGIITFAKAARHKPKYKELAERSADWAISNLYRPESGDFIYRRGRFFDHKYTLMHWCNGWMARALGEFISK